jgi:hypothetical protein
MKEVMKYLIGLFLVLNLAGCERLDPRADTVRGFFRQPPLLPVREVIQTSASIGFCAAAGLADQLGHAIPGAETWNFDGLSFIHLKNNQAYPLSLLPVPCDEIYIIRLGMDEEMCFVSAFFVSSDPRTGSQQIYHIGPVPVMLDNQHVRAIWVRNRVTLEDELKLELDLSQGEVDIALEQLRMPESEDVSVAVQQNAWVIEIDPARTWSDFRDDRIMITGGEQDVSALTYPERNAASVLQMAMMGLLIDPDCMLNPVSGFSVLQEISVATGGRQLDDLVLGTILYTFEESCTGRVRVPVATGSFLLSLGRELEFNMMQD